MALDNKYRVHEVAKDFGVSTKEITEILTKYRSAPKNHMQVLDDTDLSVIFEYLTQHNQVSDMEGTLNAQGASRKKPEQSKAETKQQTESKREEPIVQQQPTQSKVKQVHRIDTRGTGDVNLAKYDDHVDKLVDAKAERMESKGSKKQKLTKKSDQRSKPFGNKRRQEEQEKMRRLQRQQQMAALKKIPVKVMIPEEISVGELASRMKRTAADVIKGLIKLGVMASISEVIDYDTAAIVAEEMGCKVEKEVHVTIEEQLFDEHEDKEEELQPRDPVVVVMGHVDHGKTSLLDAIRKTKVIEGEAGGITQHIGAYQVEANGEKITFLDTPGHAAFTAMRARGAMATDIAVLVVAADDGIMPQTIEAINHAKAAGVEIIVAINKMDKEGANPDRVLQQLTEHELVPEEWGGNVICVPVSAKTKMGIDKLLETILLVAEMQELKANPDRTAKGTVIEAKLDKGRGPIATLLVQNGTLHAGDVIVAGMAVGKVRAMTDYRGRKVNAAGPSVPVEIMGLDSAPMSGDGFNAVSDERLARQLVEQRKEAAKEEEFNAFHKVTLDTLFDTLQAGELKAFNVVIKADVQGSVEAVKQSLLKIENDEVRVHVIHGAVGSVSESDVMLAAASNAIIVAFNTGVDPVAKENADRDGVEIRSYNIIYDAIEEIEAAMRGMRAPKYRDVDTGTAEVREVYKISSAGTIAGSLVTSGNIRREGKVRLVRDGKQLADVPLKGLKRFKDDVKDVSSGYECGISLEGWDDIQPGDVLECYVVEEYRD